MSTHTRRSRRSRLAYARHACCVPASADGYPERLVKHDGVSGSRKGGGKPLPIRHPPHGGVVSSYQLTLAERDQPLLAGSCWPNRGGQPVEHYPAVMHAQPQHCRGDDVELAGRRARPRPCRASARQACPGPGGDAAGLSLPSERTEGRPQDQLTRLATRRDGSADAVSQADVPERVRGAARLARARQRGQYSTVR